MDDKARIMSAQPLKRANRINDIDAEQPKAVDEQGDVEYCDQNLINTLNHMTRDQIIMYMKGKGKGKYNSWKGNGDKGKGKGNGDGKGGTWRKRQRHQRKG